MSNFLVVSIGHGAFWIGVHRTWGLHSYPSTTIPKSFSKLICGCRMGDELVLLTTGIRLHIQEELAEEWLVWAALGTEASLVHLHVGSTGDHRLQPAWLLVICPGQGPIPVHRGPFESCLHPPSGPGLGYPPLAFTCVGECVCVFLYEFTVHVYLLLHMCWCPYVLVCMHVCVYVWASVCMHVCTCLHVCLYMPVLMHECLCVHARVYLWIYVFLCASLKVSPFSESHFFFIFFSLPKLQFQITMKRSSSLKCLVCIVNHTYQWHLFLGWEQRLLNQSHTTVWSLCENKSWVTPHLQICFQEGKRKCLLV